MLIKWLIFQVQIYEVCVCVHVCISARKGIHFLSVTESSEKQSQFVFKRKGVRKVTVGLEYTKGLVSRGTETLAVSGEGPREPRGPQTPLCRPRRGVLTRLTVRVEVRLLLWVL